jgi:plasmid stabilization system protein ParE
MNPCILSKEAKADLDKILNYIAGQSPQNAVLVAERLQKAFELIATMPGVGHERMELKDASLRAYSVSGYLIIYDRNAEPITVLRVVRGSRDLNRLRL